MSEYHPPLVVASWGAVGGAAVTPSDSVADPAGPFRALYIGAAGTVKLTTADGSVLVLPNVGAGTILPVAFTRVWSTGTTVVTPASNLIGFK